MTGAEILKALPPGRLPADMLRLGWADLLLLFGIGLLIGVGIAVALGFLMERRPSRRAMIRATRGLAPQERILAIGHVLGRLPPELQAAAYDPAQPLDDAGIERIALRASARPVPRWWPWGRR